MAKLKREDAQIDLTPMIDVVFQLIIFFIVTIQMTKEYNRDIKMEMSPNGPPIEGAQNPLTMIIEVDRRGWISMHGAQLSKQTLRDVIRRRFNKYGSFPVLIRGDLRAKHADIRSVMDICTDVGLWRINFAAIKERRL